MSSRLDFYFRQRVTEAELDLAFSLLEQADRNLASDIGVFGLIHGADAAPHTPVADLTIHLSAPAVGYDRLGQRIFFGTEQRVDCSIDDAGLPTAVTSAGKERWLGVFLRFDRLLSDPRTDGNSQQVYFRRDESFQLVVRQGAEANAGLAQKVALQPDELLVCDVLRRFGQTQLVAGDLDASRRQAFKFVTGDAVEVVAGAWSAIAPTAPTVQAAFDAADELLAGHFRGTEHKHTAAHVAATPHGFLAATNVQAALDELVDDLAASTAGNPGALRVGADAVAGAPNALPAGTVDGQLAQLLGWLNAHLAAAVRAHAASAISAEPHHTIVGTSVQAQLQEIIAALAATTSGAAGASLVGADALAGAPSAVPAGTVQKALAALLDLVNAHVAAPAGAHTAAAIAYAGGPNWKDGTTNPATTASAQLDKLVADLAADAGAARLGTGARTSWLDGRVNPAGVSVLAALNKIITDLTDQAAGADGARRIGAQAAGRLPAGSVRSQLDALDATSARTTVANMFAATQIINGAAGDTSAALATTSAPTVRKLLWEIAGAANSYKYRLYAELHALEITVNARWDGTQWVKDTAMLPSSKLELDATALRLNSNDTQTSPFGDNWANSIDIQLTGHGQQSFDAGGNWSSSGATETYISWQGPRPSSGIVGGGAPFRKVFPATPSSITFTVLSSLNLASGPFVFFPTAAGTAAFVGAITTSAEVRFTARVFAS